VGSNPTLVNIFFAIVLRQRRGGERVQNGGRKHLLEIWTWDLDERILAWAADPFFVHEAWLWEMAWLGVLYKAVFVLA
jgi:hypothetical protein